MSKHIQAGVCKTATAHPFQGNAGHPFQGNAGQRQTHKAHKIAATHHGTTMQLLKQQTSTENR
jgi:hypothetical protein